MLEPCTMGVGGESRVTTVALKGGSKPPRLGFQYFNVFAVRARARARLDCVDVSALEQIPSAQITVIICKWQPA